MSEQNNTPSMEQREAELARREAELAAREAQLEEKTRGFLNNGDPSFKNAKEHFYDKIPLTVHQLDILIGVLMAAIVVFLVLGTMAGNG